MSRYLFSGPLLALALALTTTSLWARPTPQVALHLPDTPYRYANLELPTHFTQAGRNDAVDNPVTDDGATLGRVLFYDTRLSANDTTSCASCHIQAHAFSDPRPASQGFHGALTDRRAMPLVNLRYYQRARFFWDERARTLEEQVLMPIQSKIELGQDLDKLVTILARDDQYLRLFGKAFGDSEVTQRRVARALARHASVPVLVVRERRGRPRRVLVAVDGSDDARAAIELLARVPLPADAEITLLHVLEHGVDTLAGTELSANNGIETSPDDREFFVVSTTAPLEMACQSRSIVSVNAKRAFADVLGKGEAMVRATAEQEWVQAGALSREYKVASGTLLEALEHEIRAKDVGLMFIKALARNLWREGEQPRYATWYEPLDGGVGGGEAVPGDAQGEAPAVAGGQGERVLPVARTHLSRTHPLDGVAEPERAEPRGEVEAVRVRAFRDLPLPEPLERERLHKTEG